MRLYTCGPTVYNYAHIGNYRAYIFEDLLQRHLEARGYDVLRVMNLTDVDDKTIRGCRQLGVRLADFTKKFKDAFFVDLDALRIKRARHFPAATDYVARMIEMIGVLEKKGIAYQADDKSVYFRLSKFPDYGKLAHLDLEELRPTGRIANDEYEKESVGDFALWKAWDENDGDVRWDSPWGPGRPGWHIECSAMANALLGDELDIHCGGVDNLFPHHEAEIAQSECVTGKKFVRYWLHCAHLMVNGQKMSKSVGNFYTLRDLLEKGWTGREVRYALLTVNYRLPLNFTLDKGLPGARASLHRIDEWVARITAASAAPAMPDNITPMPLRFDPPKHTGTGGPAPGEVATVTSGQMGLLNDEIARLAEKNDHPSLEDGRLEKLCAGFFAALDDDLNISGAMGCFFDLIHESNKALDAGTLDAVEAGELLEAWNRINHVLAVQHEVVAVPAEVLALVEERQAARASKDWAGSDRLRDQIAALGWVVKDTKEGPKLSAK